MPGARRVCEQRNEGQVGDLVPARAAATQRQQPPPARHDERRRGEQERERRHELPQLQLVQHAAHAGVPAGANRDTLRASGESVDPAGAELREHSAGSRGRARCLLGLPTRWQSLPRHALDPVRLDRGQRSVANGAGYGATLERRTLGQGAGVESKLDGCRAKVAQDPPREHLRGVRPRRPHFELVTPRQHARDCRE